VRSRWLINLALFGAVIALGYLLLIAENETAAPAEPLTALAPEAITEIEIRKPGAEPVRMIKTGGRWQMTAPVAIAADEARVRPILGLLKAASRARFNPADLDLARFGLSPPLLELSLSGQTFAFGDEQPLDGSRYLLHDGRLHLIEDTVFFQLNAPFTYFVSPKLVPDNGEPSRIRLPSQVYTRGADGWQAEPPLPGGRDASAVIQAWQVTEALTVRPYEAQPPQGEIALEWPDGRVLTYAIIAPAPQLVLARPELGLQYHLDSFQARQLLLAPEDVQAESPLEPD
jgi:hypothetical protein